MCRECISDPNPERYSGPLKCWNCANGATIRVKSVDRGYSYICLQCVKGIHKLYSESEINNINLKNLYALFDPIELLEIEE